MVNGGWTTTINHAVAPLTYVSSTAVEDCIPRLLEWLGCLNLYTYCLCAARLSYIVLGDVFVGTFCIACFPSWVSRCNIFEV